MTNVKEMAEKHIRIGDLLLKAGIVTTAYIKEALDRFEEEGLPLGKVLVLSGYLSEHQLRVALALQYMVNDRLLKIEDAIAVLKQCHAASLSLEESFKAAGLVQPDEKETNKLGQLLIDCGMLSKDLLARCLETSEKTALPLGHVLCYRGLVSQPMVNKGLLVQGLIRRGQIMRDHGIDALKSAAAREKSLETLQINAGYRRRPLKGTPLFGELLTETNICSERQIRESLLASISNDKPIGRTLMDLADFSGEFVEAIVALQEMMDNETITAAEARSAIMEMKVRRTPLLKAVAESCAFRRSENLVPQLLDLLTSVGAIEITKIPREVQERTTVNYNQVPYVCKTLAAKGLCDESTIFSALRCVDMVSRSKLTRERAIIALEFALKADIDAEQALYMIGATERTRLREQEEHPPVEIQQEPAGN